jgi:hypothetical protein
VKVAAQDDDGAAFKGDCAAPLKIFEVAAHHLARPAEFGGDRLMGALDPAGTPDGIDQMLREAPVDIGLEEILNQKHEIGEPRAIGAKEPGAECLILLNEPQDIAAAQ